MALLGALLGGNAVEAIQSPVTDRQHELPRIVPLGHADATLDAPEDGRPRNRFNAPAQDALSVLDRSLAESASGTASLAVGLAPDNFGTRSTVVLACMVVPVAAVLVVALVVGIAALVSPEAMMRCRTTVPGKEFLVGAACLMIPALTAYGMFGDVDGGNMAPLGWFGWHPVLMSAAFPCLMVLGRLSSGSCAAEWMQGIDLQGRRRMHRTIMTAAVLSMLAGYLCVWLAHWQTMQFFGYDFRSHEWKPFKRIAHVWLGYGLMILAMAQGWMGGAKVESKARVYTFHGALGQFILVAGIVEMFVATWVWSWSPGMNYFMIALCCFSLIGALMPQGSKPDAQ